jgi:halimadienyl-diphosphate synthase
MLFSPRVTTVHSLEFLGPDVSPGNLEKAIFSNGSLGNSPAATAYYIHQSMQNGLPFSPASEDYLARAMNHVDPVLYLYPFRNFENMWVLNNLLMINHDILTDLCLSREVFDSIHAHLGEGGISLDGEFGIPDGDCTSVALYLLHSAGYEVDPNILARYEVPNAEIFRTYEFERNPSVSTNIHALEAIRIIKDYPNRTEKIAAICSMLLQNQHYGLYWTDKWHASPFYTTSHALIALLKADPKMVETCSDSIEWLLNIQRADGSWGFFDRGTAEETAYVILALQHAASYTSIKWDVIARGVDYLLANADLENPHAVYPEIWLGKCLFSPYDIVKSAILAALIQNEYLR